MLKIFSRFGWLLAWAVIAIFLIIYHAGFYNPDSFKYVAIAHSMWTQHHYILPLFDGQPYSDKGPIMFWLFIMGWKLTGFNQWWPQLLMGLTALASLFLTIKIAIVLWPQQRRIPELIPIILLGLPSWIVLSNEIRIDIFLLFFCLSCFFSLIMILKGKKLFWLLYGIALALAFLCKGPVVLIYTSLPALLLPFVLVDANVKLSSWYGYLFLSTAVAICIALLWVVPAAIQGGAQYYQAILFKQIYNRAFQDYSWLYYIIRIPMFILPWGLYPPFLIGAIKYSKLLNPERFCWLIIIISLIVFSIYGQKRVHYLNPDFPLFALIIAKAISNYLNFHTQPKLSHQWFISILFLLSAATILWLPHSTMTFNPAIQTQLFYILKYNTIIAPLLLILALVYFFYCPKTLKQQMVFIMLPSAAIATIFLILRVVPGFNLG